MSEIIMVPVCSKCHNIISDVEVNTRLIEPIKCPYCDSVFTNFISINDLSNGIHLNTEPSVCEKNNELHYI